MPDPIPSQRNARTAGAMGIGVTGHRLGRLGDAHLEIVRIALRDLFGELTKLTASPHPPRLITSLADGADTIAAEEAVSLGWTVDAVLPMARDDYLSDFTAPDARRDHETLLSAANSVFELDGDRTADDGSAIAYERAGRVVLAQSDILVAVWDGLPVRGRGGAAQIIAEAVLAGIPVIHVDPGAAHPPQLLWDGLDEHDLGQQTIETVPRGDLSALPGLIRGLLDPPVDEREQMMLDRFESPARPRRNWALAYPLLLAIVGVRRFRKSDFIVADPARALPVILGRCSGAVLNAAGLGTALRNVLAPRFARG